MGPCDESRLSEHVARRQRATDYSKSAKIKVNPSPSSPPPDANCTKPLPPLPAVSDTHDKEFHPPVFAAAASFSRSRGATTLSMGRIVNSAAKLFIFRLCKRTQKNGKLPKPPEMVDQGTQVSLSNDLRVPEARESHKPHIRSMPTGASGTGLFHKQESPTRDARSTLITPSEFATRNHDYFGFAIEPLADHGERNSSSAQSTSPTTTLRQVRRSDSQLRHVSFAPRETSSVAESSLNSIGTYESRYSSREPRRMAVVRNAASEPALLVTPPRRGRSVNRAADNMNPFTNITEAGKSPFSDPKGNKAKPAFQRFIAYQDVPKAFPSRAGRPDRSTSSSTVSPLRQELTLPREVDQASVETLVGGRIDAPQTSLANISLRRSSNWFNVPLQIPFHDLDGESNIPVHLPGSTLCPMSAKYRSGGTRICPMHGPHLHRDLESPRTETSPWVNHRAKQPPLVTVLTMQTTSDHNAVESDAFWAFKLRAPEHDLGSPMCPANANNGGKELCVYHGRGRAVKNGDEMPKRPIHWSLWS